MGIGDNCSQNWHKCDEKQNSKFQIHHIGQFDIALIQNEDIIEKIPYAAIRHDISCEQAEFCERPFSFDTQDALWNDQLF